MRKCVNTTVYLTPDQLEALRELSIATKVPAAEYMREGLDLVLIKHGVPMLDGVRQQPTPGDR